MRRNKILLKHLALIAAIGIPVLTVRFVFRDFYTEQLRAFSQAASTSGAQERGREWDRLRYMPSTDGALARVLSDAETNVASRLAPQEAALLRTKLAEVGSYLEAPSFDRYYRLRTDCLTYRFVQPSKQSSLLQEGMKFTSNLQIASETLAFALTNSSLALTNDSEKMAVRSAWAHSHESTNAPYVPEITAFCPDYITSALAHTNTVRSLTGGAVSKGYTAYVVQPNPGFLYPLEPNQTLQTGGSNVFFQISLYCKSRNGLHAGPLYLSLWWLPNESTWTLGGLITDKGLQIKTIF